MGQKCIDLFMQLKVPVIATFIKLKSPEGKSTKEL